MLHVLIAAMWILLFGSQILNPPKRMIWLELDPSLVTPKKLKKNEPNSDRIVQSDKGQRTDMAAPDAFLGERTQTVDAQTIGRTHTTAAGADKVKPKSPPKTIANTEAKSESKSETYDKPLQTFGLPILPMQRFAKGSAADQAYDSDQPDWAESASSPDDYVPGIKQSEKTMLNTKEYMFYGYFQRIRHRLDLAWEPILREHLVKLYNNGRRLASDIDHTTKVVVTLNTRGEIIKVEVVEESGTRLLDDAAVKAFNRAGPFPNPPKGIIGSDGIIKIRWDFILKT